MPKFGQPAGQRTVNRNKALYISNFKDAATVTRFLWEDPDTTWYTYPEHYDFQLKLSFPCVKQHPDFPFCLGCTMPVVDETLDDPDERRKDHGWTVRRISTRFVVPTLNERGFITLRKVSGTFKDQMAGHWKVMHSITNSDWTISRTGDGFDVKFTASPTGAPEVRKYTDELRNLYLAVQAGMHNVGDTALYEEAWAQWNAGNAEVGVPNGDALDAILGQKYLEAINKYEVPDEELARRAQIRAAAEASRGEGGADASFSPPIGTGVPPAAAAPVQQAATVETADQGALAELGRLSADLQAWGVPFPMDANLEQMRLLHGTFAASRTPAPVQPAVTAPAAPPVAVPEQPAAAVAPTPAPAAPAAAPAAPYEPQPPAPGTPTPPPTGDAEIPPFEEWSTPDVRDWLNDHQVPWTKIMPRSQLLTLARQSITGF